MLLRTTHPVADEAAYLSRLAEVGLWWGDVSTPGPHVDVRRLSDIRPTLKGWQYYDEFLQPHGWQYLAGLLFWNEQGDFLGQLTLHRVKAQGDFSDEEIALLHRVHPHIAAAVARLQRLDGRHSGRNALEQVLRPLPFRVVIANWNGRVEFMNRAGIEALHAWTMGSRSARAIAPEARPQLPVAIAEGCGRLRRRYEAAVREGSFQSFDGAEHVVNATIASGSVEISILPSDFRQAIHPAFLISFQSPVGPTNEGVSLAERCAMLTPSERTVARLAGEGESNPEIAKKIGVSINTVRTHLRRVFEKLDIRRRARLAGIGHLIQ
ncbi:MAG: LuxR C-terminal-related transcriptional regulator [Chthoniobacteraceae bacterium]